MGKIIVSGCLAGVPCRWDGEAKPCRKVIELVIAGEAIPLCPEQLGGLSTPREPSEIIGESVFSKSGKDVTERFRKGADIVAKIAQDYGCTEAILKSRSPSCGSGEIYDGTFAGRLVDGDGMTTRALKKIGVDVRSEDDC